MGHLNRIKIAASLLLLAMVLESRPASAQVELTGDWGMRLHEDWPHRWPGPDLGDYTGLPINDAARLKADSWDASLLTLREHQAKPHPSAYSLWGPTQLRISKEVDPVTALTVAFKIYGTYGSADRTIWMDGRAHPPEYAAHTWAGFSTGKWDDDMLTVETTHLKVGFLQRNGIAQSDQATLTEKFIRHGDYLTVVILVDDPVYLTEPFIRTANWVLDLSPVWADGFDRFKIVDEIAGRPEGFVPHYLPGSDGARLKLREFATKYGLPAEAARGGAETTYPEYRLKLKAVTPRAKEK